MIVFEHLAGIQSSQLHHLFYRFMHLWSGRNYTLYNVVYMHNHNIVNVALDTRVKLAVKPLFDIDCYLLMLFILTCCLWIRSNLREEKLILHVLKWRPYLEENWRFLMYVFANTTKLIEGVSIYRFTFDYIWHVHKHWNILF